MHQDEKAESLEGALNNITVRLFYEDEEYFLLLKKQQSGEYSLFFITDFCSNFWVKRITYDYLTELRNQLKIRTSTKVFIDHLAYGIRENCKILEICSYALLMIRLIISDGLVMTCKIKLDTHINIDDKPDNFKSLLKVFGKQLYEAKDKQVREEQMQDESKYQNKLKLNKEDSVGASKLFVKPENKMIPEKYRDLINPYKKKRKMEGVKIGVPMEKNYDTQ